jgi:hypothetical protein
MGRQLIDLTGDRYGRLVVLSEAERDGYTRRWLCRCDCGNEVVVRMPLLRTGHTTSCGCLHRERASAANTEDLTGKRFGRLVVQHRADQSRRKHRVSWVCLCDCGNVTTVTGDHLADGTTQSCGCLKKDKGNELYEYNKKHSFKDDVFVPVLKSKVRKDNTTGIKGVTRVRKKNGEEVYKATIMIKGKTYFLGYHATLEAASEARKRGEDRYHRPYLEDNNNEQ